MKTHIMIVFFVCISVYNLLAQSSLSSEHAYHESKSNSEQSIQIQAFPNPFSSQIQFNVDITEPAQARLAIFDIIGKELFTLVNKSLPADTYSFTWKPENLSPGIYIYVLSIGNSRKTGKILHVNGNKL